MFYTILNELPVGEVLVTSKNGEFINGIYINNTLKKQELLTYSKRVDTIFIEVNNQLKEYFAGTRTEFSIPIQQSGTDFQQKVWNELTKIKYADTNSYKDIAHKIGSAHAVRGVGKANSKNVINILVPCHRVIAANGNISGYNCGIEVKRWLLEHEKKFSNIHNIVNFK